MPPTSLKDIDLSPIPGKTYFNIAREWREEFVYFLLVDRFHDSTARAPAATPNRTPGMPTQNAFYGGTLKGITRNLDYIAGLGASAIWLSPVFENNAGAYHGYNVNNYLGIDPHFGSKADLVELVDKAHAFKKGGKPWPIRIILDVVINHSGNNWRYPFDADYVYSNDQQFPLDAWRLPDRPIPTELRNPDYYHRRGNMTGGGYDQYPELQHGDMSGLKDFANDDDQAGSELINILIQAHCYWIREADIDGFRVDAVKHMGELACSRFCSGVREYAYTLGKRNFFLFGEVATPSDEVIDRYIGQNTSIRVGDKTVYFGLNSVLDFRLAQGDLGTGLRDVLKGAAGPATLFARLADQEKRALNRGELGRYLVTFVDNHDSFWQPGRFAKGADDNQVIAAIGYLLCSLGMACVYYGTEQGFEGSGGDEGMREALFDAATPGRNLLNPSCRIYQEIAKIAAVHASSEPLRFGRMYFREISGDGVSFGLPGQGLEYMLAFSRLLYGREVLVAYNTSASARQDFVIVDGGLHAGGSTMKRLYGSRTAPATVTVQRNPGGPAFVRLPLAGHEFAIYQ
ncbi:MAG TPA: alpha-amylase family glycosyl hydrolase [Planctomycetota bacterium]|nr:alpha-amylase family glycosyl hydrolase [Planctomycetota bacterium]